jgi:lysophospholipase L1-like esterase
LTVILKNIALIISFALHAFTAHAQILAYDTVPYALEYHDSRLETFSHEPVVQGKTIFLGNSLTEFCDWKKHLNDSTIINRGIAGDNTYGVLKRLNDIIVRRPSRLLIEIGINDIAKNIPDSIIAINIFQIVKSVKKILPETIVFVYSVLPTNDAVKKEYSDAFNKNSHVVNVNKLLKAEQRKAGFIYIDTYKMLADKNGKLNKKYALEDGLHIGSAGYQLWIKLLKDKKYL